MHTIYNTECFILKSLNYGEANRYFFIFSKDFGLIKAAAQGVRHLKSKLRYSLEDFSYGQISLVKGKEVWRITSAEKKLEIRGIKKLKLLSQISSLFLRLLHGEGKNDVLFDSLKEGMFYLAKNDISDEDSFNLECILALRVLSSLGYLGKSESLDQFITSSNFSRELLSSMSVWRSSAVLEINRSLKETHL